MQRTHCEGPTGAPSVQASGTRSQWRRTEQDDTQPLARTNAAWVARTRIGGEEGRLALVTELLRSQAWPPTWTLSSVLEERKQGESRALGAAADEALLSPELKPF